MFRFIESVFAKTASLVAALLISVGLVSAPTPANQPIIDNASSAPAEQELNENSRLSAEALSALEGLRSDLAQERIKREALEKSLIGQSSDRVKSSVFLTNEEIVVKVKPAVVYVIAGNGRGSGFILESNGYILTNAHVVKDYSWVTIKLSSGESLPATVVGKDEVVDLALLKINRTGLPTVEVGNSDSGALKQGTEVFVLGYPFGIEGDVSFKEGTLSRRLNDGGIEYLEISAAIHSGNSGGPLVNRLGQAVGVNTFVFGKAIGNVILGETIKFALPINTAKNYIPDLKLGRNISATQTVYAPTPSPTPAPEPTSKPVVKISLLPTDSGLLYYKAIKSGEVAVVYWNVYDTNSCYASGDWSGSKPSSGSQSFSPSRTATYRLDCSNSFGSIGGEVTIQIVE